ncbi:hypothetical protein [Nitrosospira multiformis]|jgi:hypothetical protein|uniref:hypothetical protein n=1 Tax=Nitrosospira multiformis TaxID=1231 RepID=UPI00210F1F75|nr:hypothetical protein [Nitrosospira multiformis]
MFAIVQTPQLPGYIVFLSLILMTTTGDNMKGARKLLYLAIFLLAAPGLSGCWLLAAGGAGAYGGYKMKEEGYTLQNPVTKEKRSDQQEKD